MEKPDGSNAEAAAVSTGAICGAPAPVSYVYWVPGTICGVVPVVVVVVVVVNVCVPGTVPDCGVGAPPSWGTWTVTCGTWGRLTLGRFGSGSRVLTTNGVGTPMVTVVCLPL